MNTGTGFRGTRYGSESALVQTEEIDEDSYKRTYYVQQPLRKWKAFSGGNIEIIQNAGLVDGDRVSIDGVRAVTYPAGDDSYSINLLPGHEEGSSIRQYGVSSGDEMYFLMDEGVDTGSSQGREVRGDDVNWNVDIRYLDIKYFEDMGMAGIIDPDAGGESFETIVSEGRFVPSRIPEELFAMMLEEAGDTTYVYDGEGNITGVIPGESKDA